MLLCSHVCQLFQEMFDYLNHAHLLYILENSKANDIHRKWDQCRYVLKVIWRDDLWSRDTDHNHYMNLSMRIILSCESICNFLKNLAFWCSWITTLFRSLGSISLPWVCKRWYPGNRSGLRCYDTGMPCRLWGFLGRGWSTPKTLSIQRWSRHYKTLPAYKTLVF